MAYVEHMIHIKDYFIYIWRLNRHKEHVLFSALGFREAWHDSVRSRAGSAAARRSDVLPLSHGIRAETMENDRKSRRFALFCLIFVDFP